MSRILINAELKELYHTWFIADIDYNDHGGSRDRHEFADRARDAQTAFKKRRDELLAAGVEIWEQS